jgi:hypothetical protein
MSKYKYKEKDGIVNVMDGDAVVARYEIDRHWTEKNISEKDGSLSIRLYNRMKGFQDCKVEINNDTIQKIPNER